ncbi:apolipoprotein A-Ib [Takifugu flavidus]|uniref:Apolipoprotein A-I n=1 Tax=Takifugu flavidus TaxID=433684 RepID=A0A5C6PD69_9TELE|nr:apolipoprotein A-Ib [Takifugu flavidus]TWW76681.1 Apolipoprotein A-I [Takifugu flavidus]
MKFVVLALALLLAVGSQAASLMADAPTELEHFRSALNMYLDRVKERAHSALATLDDPEYKELKDRLAQRVDDIHSQIKTLQGNVSPITDSVVSTISDATSELRTNIQNDFKTLQDETAAQREKLRAVVEQHLNEYRTMLQPIVSEYQAKHKEEMDALKLKLDPVMEELRKKIAVNVEETKGALMPIVEKVHTKLAEYVEQIKAVVTPYVNEYKEELRDTYNRAMSLSSDDLNAMRSKIDPIVDEIKEKVGEIGQIVSSTFAKN